MSISLDFFFFLVVVKSVSVEKLLYRCKCLCTLTLSHILCKKKLRNGGSHPALSSFKKELWNEHLHAPAKGSSRDNSSPAVESDSLLLPFVFNPQLSPKTKIVSPSVEGSSLGSYTSDDNLERYEQIVLCSVLKSSF